MNTQQIEKVLVERDGKVGIIRLNRPEVLNCLDPDTLSQLRAHLEYIQSEKRIDVVLICGNGRAFSSGMDLKYAKGKDAQTILAVNQLGLETLSYIQQFPKPTIAVVQGYALGGGFELALSCDLRFASKEQAIFGFPEINLGILPTFGGLFLPADLIGISRTMEFIFTGTRIDAETAYKLGIVNRIVPHDQLFDMALSFAKELARKGSFLLQLAKLVIRRSAQVTHTDRLRLTTAAAELIIKGTDQEEGLKRLRDK